MFVDPNQIYRDRILGGPKSDEIYDIQPTWTLLRAIIRKQKIQKIYGTQNSNRKEEF